MTRYATAALRRHSLAIGAGAARAQRAGASGTTGVVAGRVDRRSDVRAARGRERRNRRHDARRDRRRERPIRHPGRSRRRRSCFARDCSATRRVERAATVRAGDTTRVEFALRDGSRRAGRGAHGGATRRARAFESQAERRDGADHGARGGGCAEVRRAGHHPHRATAAGRRGAQRFLDRAQRARRRVGSESHPHRRLSDLQPVSPRRLVQHVHRSDGRATSR